MPNNLCFTLLMMSYSLITKRLIPVCFIAVLYMLSIPTPSFSLDCINTKFLFDIKPNPDQPSDLSIGPNGYIYLVDGVNNRIIVVDNKGRWKFAFGKMGSGKGQFRYPLGIDISKSGKVFIADSGNHRIQVFDLKGKFLYMFKVKSGPGEKPTDPVDVLASALNNFLYISDNNNHKIRTYRQNGAFDFEWGSFGEENEMFRYPGIMALNKFNEVFVVDILNTRVQKFTPHGEFISNMGSWGVLQGNLFRPKGVAIDKKSRVFISDSYMGVVQVFTDMGKFLGVICEKDKKRKFITPVGMVVDKKNRLLVVEMRANKITVLKILE